MHVSGFQKQFHWAGLLLLLLIAGCSPHPGSGTWIPLTEEGSSFSRLDVHYNGRAELHASGEEEIVWHCFWVGINESDISMECVPSHNTDIEQQYQLIVVPRESARLMMDGNELGRFSWQPIEK